MTAIVVKQFSGLKPIVSSKLLAASEAQTAQNARLVSGALLPMRATNTLQTLNLSGPATIYRYGTSSTETNYWLEFAFDTDVMRSPIASDSYDRLYWTYGAGKPRYAPNNLILQSGSGAYPRASYELGIPAPSTKATIDSFSAVVNYETVTRDYVMTFYNPTAGKESAPTVTVSVACVDGKKVSFSSLTTSNLGDTGVTKKRLYRKVSGTFRRIGEIDLATTTFDDEQTDASLASASTLPTGFGAMPQAPKSAPTVSAPTATTTAAATTRQYVYTIKNITYGGEFYSESAPSAVRSVSADATQTVTISGLTNSNGGTHFRIYRKDANSSQYQLVAEVPTSQTSVTDPLSSTVLGSTLDYDGPSGSAPGSAPTGSAGSSGATSVVKRIYMITYIDASGNESSKSPASSVVSVVDGSTTVSVYHSETTPAGVTKKRLYRQTVTTSNGLLVTDDANWKLVSEDSASSTSATDSAADSTLTGVLATGLRNLPPTPSGSVTAKATIPPKEVGETRTYVYTYVSAYGEEGPPSPASDVKDVDPAKTVTISLAGAPAGNYNITLKRIYRSSTVGSQAQFQFVAEIPVATGSYADSKLQAALGEVLPSEDWVGPPAGLKGLRLMANGAAVGFLGKTLYFSEPNLPHAWPHQYPIDFDIVGIATYGQTVAVMTTSYPYLFQGIDPAAMSSTKLPLQQACVSKRSIVETGNGVLYASPDGLVEIGATNDVITKNSLSRDQWQAYVPSSIDSYIYNGRIHCLYNTGSAQGCLVFDFTGQGAVMTTNNFNAATAVTAGFYDASTDKLYFAQGGSIVRFDQGSLTPYTWKSKVFRLSSPENLGFAQVVAETYPVTFKLYCEGVLKMTKTVNNNNQFRLPSGYRAYDWEFQLEGTAEVAEVVIASSTTEMKSA